MNLFEAAVDCDPTRDNRSLFSSCGGHGFFFASEGDTRGSLAVVSLTPPSLSLGSRELKGNFFNSRRPLHFYLFLACVRPVPLGELLLALLDIPCVLVTLQRTCDIPPAYCFLGLRVSVWAKDGRGDVLTVTGPFPKWKGSVYDIISPLIMLFSAQRGFPLWIEVQVDSVDGP